MGINLPPMRRPPPPMRPKRKSLKDIGKEAPKMFYTPDEIDNEDAFIELYFMNTNLVNPILFDNDKPEITEHGLIAFKLCYEKIKLINAKVDYVYVQFEQKNQFLKMYLGQQLDKNGFIQNKKYI
jgi:hypothetical protein